jgi:hypothetical protein
MATSPPLGPKVLPLSEIVVYAPDPTDHVVLCAFVAFCFWHAGKALRTNITTLGPKVLPLSEIVVFAGNLIARKVLRVRGVKPYVPDFQEAAQHICIHTG